MNKYVKMLLISLKAIESNNLILKNILLKEQEECIQPFEIMKNVEEIEKIFYGFSKDFPDDIFLNSDVDKLNSEALMNLKIQHNKNRKDENIVFDVDWEKQQLPKGLLDSIVCMSVLYSYIEDKLMITVNKLSMTEFIKKLQFHIDKIVKYMEKEFILDAYLVDKNGVRISNAIERRKGEKLEITLIIDKDDLSEKEFNINGIKASIRDFGNRSNYKKYGKYNWIVGTKFIPIKSRKHILEKYKINQKEYNYITYLIEKELS